MRVHTTSLGLDPGTLSACRDVVLDIDLAHGTELADGVFAHDALDIEERRRIDELAVDALERWREEFGEPMTVDGVCWPWIWEWRLQLAIFPQVHRALALRRAAALHGPTQLEVADTDPTTWALAAAVAGQLGVGLRLAPGAKPPASAVKPAERPPLHVRVRRAALGTAKRLGMPTALRRGSVIFHSYWPIEPLLDAMLASPDWRPAVCLDKLPTGANRWLRAAAQGGWMGLPTFRDHARARRQARTLAEPAARATFGVDGVDLSVPFRSVLEHTVAEHRDELADVPMLRRALRRGRARWLVGAYDSAPKARLVVALANEAGLPTLGVSHGAYLVPQTMTDLDIFDEAALWTLEVAPRMDRWGRRVHLIGYPLPHHRPPAEPATRPPARPRVLVLGQYANIHTALPDKRLTARSWQASVEAVLERLPDASVVLRPHPGRFSDADRGLAERFPGTQVTIDRTSSITHLLEQADLCIGGTSTATLQSALAGTPAIALNLSGFDWPWPLGGETSVPVARSRKELDAALERFAREGSLPGRDDMLDALGADGGDSVAKLLDILAAGPGRARPLPDPRIDSVGEPAAAARMRSGKRPSS